MSNVTGNNYRQSETGSVDNVMLNAYVNCVCRQLLRCDVLVCVMLRCVCFVKAIKRTEIGRFVVGILAFCKCVGRRLTGIVKILSRTVCTFSTLLKCTNYAHRNFLKLQHVENTVLLSLGLALKIRVSAVRFCPRPPDSPRSFARSCGVFLWVLRFQSASKKARRSELILLMAFISLNRSELVLN